MKKFNILLLLVSVLLFSCKKNGSITVNMEHRVADKDFEMNTMKYESSVGHYYEITTLKYYISEFELIQEDGTSVTVENAYLIDLKDNKTNFSFDIPNLLPGKYTEVKFRFGFAKENNVETYIDNTLENQNMFWPIPLGPGAYHYMKFEGRYDSLKTGVIKNFIYHAGPTYGADNSFEVSLPIEDGFAIDGNDAFLNLDVNIQEWFQNPSDYDFKLHKNVMMDQEVQDIYKANGRSVFKFESVSY